jgi:hypothetical protein
MKKRIDDQCPKTQKQLLMCIRDVWLGLTKKTIRNTIYHMLEVSEGVLEAQGGYRQIDL